MLTNTAALGSEALAEEENERFGSLGKFARFEISFRALKIFVKRMCIFTVDALQIQFAGTKTQKDQIGRAFLLSSVSYLKS